MTISPFSLAKLHFLDQNSVSLTELESVLHLAYGDSIDAADIFYQSNANQHWVLEDGKVKDGSFHLDQGAGIRSMVGEKTGLAYSEDLSLSALQKTAKAARKIVTSGKDQSFKVNNPSNFPMYYPAENPMDMLKAEKIIALLSALDKRARSLDPKVKQVIASFSCSHQRILIMSSDGTFNADSRPLTRLSISVIVENGTQRERGNAGGGGRYLPMQYFWNNKGEPSETAFQYVDEAVRQALINFDAKPSPAGQMTVVLGNGWPGILLHEAIGHGLEGDFNRKKTSVFSNLMGQSIANESCTVVDDGTLENKRGSLTIDDEGVPSQNTTLIKNGKLVNYMQDKRNARLLGTKSTGNGRRESYAHQCIPRMTNTYMLPGQYDPNEIIQSVEKGIFAQNFGGGQVDITSGKFVFSASESYLIENGKITHPLKGATLTGSGAEVLKKVSMIGNDLSMDPGVGVCGKDGQSVPVGVGQPTVKVEQLLVGGTETS